MEKYRPSNGTEGADFICHFCGNCERDKNEDCPIVAATFAYDVDDPEYPPEWRYAENGHPECTAFVPLGDPLPIARCEQTTDMFAAAPSPAEGDANA